MSTVRLDIHNSDVPALCRSCEARHKGVCGALSPLQLVALSRHTKISTVAAGSTLVETEEQITRYANILSGVVKLTKLMSDGRQQIVGLQFAPDFFGRPFKTESDVSAEAATEVRLCSFPKTVLEQFIRDSPELGHSLHLQSLKELDEARDWMLTLGRKSAYEKVASFLHLIALHSEPERAQPADSVVFELPLSRADIADFLGLTIETVSRQLTHLRQNNVITIDRKILVTVPEFDRLIRACGS